MRLLRPLSIATAALLIVVPSVLAAAPTPGVVAGTYTYNALNNPEAPRSLAVFAAEGSASTYGAWAQFDPTTGAVRRTGRITCLVIAGTEAWMAGPETWRAPGLTASAGNFFYVRDGGSPGAGHDLALTWFGDPGQPLSEMVGW